MQGWWPVLGWVIPRKTIRASVSTMLTLWRVRNEFIFTLHLHLHVKYCLSTGDSWCQVVRYLFTGDHISQIFFGCTWDVILSSGAFSTVALERLVAISKRVPLYEEIVGICLGYYWNSKCVTKIDKI